MIAHQSTYSTVNYGFMVPDQVVFPTLLSYLATVSLVPPSVTRLITKDIANCTSVQRVWCCESMRQHISKTTLFKVKRKSESNVCERAQRTWQQQLNKKIPPFQKSTNGVTETLVSRFLIGHSLCIIDHVTSYPGPSRRFKMAEVNKITQQCTNVLWVCRNCL